MQKPRRHERIYLLADVAVQPNDKRPQRFAAEMFNISKSGAAVFSRRHFTPGEIVGVELNLPTGAGRRRAFMLYGTVRHAKVQPEGNVLGIEFVVAEDAGDYQDFERYMEKRTDLVGGRRGGFTLIEACIAMTVICLLVTMGIPLYTRAVEQSRLDVASAKLRTIWSAQRVYWLEHRSYAGGLGPLDAMDLLDPSVVASQGSPDAVYVYQLIYADEDSFLARAARNGSTSWTGQIEIDEVGSMTGLVNGPNGQQLAPTP